jgi:hypothetical protein
MQSNMSTSLQASRRTSEELTTLGCFRNPQYCENDKMMQLCAKARVAAAKSVKLKSMLDEN